MGSEWTAWRASAILLVDSRVSPSNVVAISNTSAGGLHSWPIVGAPGRLATRMPESHPGHAQACARSSGESAKTNADAAYADLVPATREWRDAEELTLQQIADRLNEQGHTAQRSRPWNHVQVMRVGAVGGEERATVITVRMYQNTETSRKSLQRYKMTCNCQPTY